MVIMMESEDIIESLKDLIEEMEYSIKQLDELAEMKLDVEVECFLKKETIEEYKQKIQLIVDDNDIF